MTTSQFTEDFPLLIGGARVDGAHRTYPIVHPATQGGVGLAREASAERAEAAAGAAAEAFDSWSRPTPEERANLLDGAGKALPARGDDFIPLVIAETGCTAT